MPAIYILGLKVLFNGHIGALGRLKLNGAYFYIGSDARWPKRLLRHLRTEKKLKWHIDYLTSCRNRKILFWVVFPGIYGREKEKTLAEIAAREFEVIGGFGSTDTGAKGHLFKIDSFLKFLKFVKKAEAALGTAAVVMIPGLLSSDEEPGL